MVTAEKVASSYLDVGDNVQANVDEWLESNCGDSSEQWFIPGICDNGHRIVKMIACGKEWCPVCNQIGSIAHNRRYVRWLTKIMQFKKMRYIVFTIPEDLRPQYRTKAALTKLGRQAQELLKSLGYSRGLRRWHWFGDRSHKWHPHLNVLVEGGYMPAEMLAAIKCGWSKILGTDIVDVSVKYKGRPEDMTGCLHYITRATFKDYNYDIDMAIELRGFRNMVVWGRDWHNEPVWMSDSEMRKTDNGESLDVQAIERIVQGICPVDGCDYAIHWKAALPKRIIGHDLPASIYPYGAGYYRVLRPHEWIRPAGLVAPDINRLINMRSEHQVRFEAHKHRKPVFLNQPGFYNLDNV